MLRCGEGGDIQGDKKASALMVKKGPVTRGAVGRNRYRETVLKTNQPRLKCNQGSRLKVTMM